MGPRAVLGTVAVLAAVVGSAGAAVAGSAVVTRGRFTNVYVYPTPDTETWEAHMASLRPADAAQFSRASIDRFTEALMSPAWPSYFDALFQYSGIRPPRFFGSAVASQKCVDAALKDRNNGVLQWDTVRSLANCHRRGKDPSPQVNLIFSPDIRIAAIVVAGTGGDMCTTGTASGWHAWGINTPNYTVLPTSTACFATFANFTSTLSHEIVETISDPGGMGMGDLGANELSDNCPSNLAPNLTTWNGYTVQRYWSNFDGNCQPKLDPPAGSRAETWILGEGAPLQRLTRDAPSVTLNVPAGRVSTSALATQVMIVIQTGADDLRGGTHQGENVDVRLRFTGGTSPITTNINNGRTWANGGTHAALLTLPASAPVSSIAGVTIRAGFGGDAFGDNWNIDKVALIVSFPTGSTTTLPAASVVHDWLDVSGAPLIRFTGQEHGSPLEVAPSDAGLTVRALEVVIATGNDDLRGGKNAGDNCNVTVQLTSGARLTVTNANQGQTWKSWTTHTVPIPLGTRILHGGDVASVTVRTRFGGGIDGDNWNVNRVQLRATLE